MQVKPGGRAPSLGTYAAREQEPSVWHMQPGIPLWFPKYSCLPLVRPPHLAEYRAQNNSPIRHPGLTTLNLGGVHVVLCLLAVRRILGQLQKGVRRYVL